MTTMTVGGRVPDFTLGWRMRLALETAELSVNEMSTLLGYSRSTISRWLNDQDPPRAAVIAQWCLLTGVDQDWLLGGVVHPTPDPNGGSSSRVADQLARLTERKRNRARSETGHTRRYVPAACAA